MTARIDAPCSPQEWRNVSLLAHCQQAAPSPAFKNSPLGWLRAAAGSYRGEDLPAFSMGLGEVCVIMNRPCCHSVVIGRARVLGVGRKVDSQYCRRTLACVHALHTCVQLMWVDCLADVALLACGSRRHRKTRVYVMLTYHGIFRTKAFVNIYQRTGCVLLLVSGIDTVGSPDICGGIFRSSVPAGDSRCPNTARRRGLP